MCMVGAAAGSEGLAWECMFIGGVLVDWVCVARLLHAELWHQLPPTK